MALVTVRLVNSFQVIPHDDLRQTEIINGNEVRWWLVGCGDGPFSMTFEGKNPDDEDVSDAIAEQFFGDLVDGQTADWVKPHKTDPWRRNGVVIGERDAS